jgi:hypothetical protein
MGCRCEATVYNGFVGNCYGDLLARGDSVCRDGFIHDIFVSIKIPILAMASALEIKLEYEKHRYFNPIYRFFLKKAKGHFFLSMCFLIISQEMKVCALIINL